MFIELVISSDDVVYIFVEKPFLGLVSEGVVCILHFLIVSFHWLTYCLTVTVISCLADDPNLDASDHPDLSMDYNLQDVGWVTCFWHWQEVAMLLQLI